MKDAGLVIEFDDTGASDCLSRNNSIVEVVAVGEHVVVEAKNSKSRCGGNRRSPLRPSVTRQPEKRSEARRSLGKPLGGLFADVQRVGSGAKR